jgi:transcriptional regulator with GAF, ATPase, and Fis domain
VEVRLSRLDFAGQSLLLSLTRDVTERKQAENKLKSAFEEIRELKNQLEQENTFLREEIEVRYRHEEIVGESQAIRRVLAAAERVAREDTCVLILGETGTGKELLARAIHNMSPRKGRSMIKVNCAALPATLIERELFGHEKGAFTGATAKQIGRFEAAHQSTLFLDEIGDLPLDLQAKLLRVLEDHRFERLGSTQTISADVRVIASTNANLADQVQNKSFRRDLYYRLNVFPITMPPLRERREDIPLLVWALVKEFSQSMGKSIKHIPGKTMELFKRQDWPGNIRQLRNVIERGMILTDGHTLTANLFENEGDAGSDEQLLNDVIRNHILQALKRTRGTISGPNGAARLLGLKVSTLRSKMQKLDIVRQDSAPRGWR